MKISFELNSVQELPTLYALVGRMKSDAAGQQDISGLDLMQRTKNCLRAENIHVLADLQGWSETDLLRTPNLGKRSLNEIKEKMAIFGLPPLRA